MLKNFLFTRPDWFEHEGYWRLAQVFRLGPAFLFLTICVVCLVASFYLAGVLHKNIDVALGLAAAWFAGAVAYVIAVHWLLRLIVWITEGFRERG